MAPIATKPFHLRVTELPSGTLVYQDSLSSFPGETHTFTKAGILKDGFQYKVSFYSDANQNGVYDGPPIDPAWELGIATATSHVNFSFVYNKDFKDVSFTKPEKKSASILLSGVKVGTLVQLKAQDLSTNRFPIDTVIAKTTKENFNLELKNQLVPGKTYQFKLYIDTNNTQGYEAGIDPAWNFNPILVAGDVVLDLTKDAIPGDVAFAPDSVFTLSVLYTGFNAFRGKRLAFKLFSSTGDVLADSTNIAIISNDLTVVSQNVIKSNQAYTLYSYIDLNSNKGYDPGLDSSWKVTFSSTPGNLSLGFPTNWVSSTEAKFLPDTAYNLNINGSGFLPAKGVMVKAVLMDSASGKIKGEKSVSQVSTDAIKLSFPDAIHRDSSYIVALYVDRDSSGRYELSDYSKFLPVVKGASEINVSVSFDTTKTNLGNLEETKFDLKFLGSNFLPCLGNPARLILRDRTYNRIILDKLVPQITTDQLELDLGEVLVKGRSYLLDISVDMNRNGKWDTAPTDYTWRINLLNISEEENYSFTVNSDFAQVEMPAMPLTKLSVSLGGLTTLSGKQLYYWVKDVVFQKYILTDSISITAAEKLDFTKNISVIPGRLYSLDLSADVNGNKKADSPPTDQSWRYVFEVKPEDIVIDQTLDNNYTDLWK